jgi:hypothetical protein
VGTITLRNGLLIWLQKKVNVVNCDYGAFPRSAVYLMLSASNTPQISGTNLKPLNVHRRKQTQGSHNLPFQRSRKFHSGRLTAYILETPSYNGLPEASPTGSPVSGPDPSASPRPQPSSVTGQPAGWAAWPGATNKWRVQTRYGDDSPACRTLSQRCCRNSLLATHHVKSKALPVTGRGGL